MAVPNPKFPKYGRSASGQHLLVSLATPPEPGAAAEQPHARLVTGVVCQAAAQIDREQAGAGNLQLELVTPKRRTCAQVEAGAGLRRWTPADCAPRPRACAALDFPTGLLQASTLHEAIRRYQAGLSSQHSPRKTAFCSRSSAFQRILLARRLRCSSGSSRGYCVSVQHSHGLDAACKPPHLSPGNGQALFRVCWPERLGPLTSQRRSGLPAAGLHKQDAGPSACL